MVELGSVRMNILHSGIRISQNEYISEMKEIPIARTKQAQRFSPLNAREIDELKSLVSLLHRHTQILVMKCWN